jgi:methylated-DNA-[protein]-cysteine S-methyltransferase
VSALSYTWLESPAGRLLLAGDGDALKHISFPSGRHAVEVDRDWREEPSVFAAAIEQLREYFRGERKTFSLRLSPEGTAFQKAVWSELRNIPYGETISYKQLAERIGKPRAVRAVGAANGANPIPIIIPCHRVIGNDGHLTGFGGGLPLKQRLLDLESQQLPLLSD